MDITRGNLDDISRPARINRSRPGSRVSLRTPSSAGSTRQDLETSNSLEILPPESPTLNQREFDLEVVELFSSDSDSQSDTAKESTTDPKILNVNNTHNNNNHDKVTKNTSDASADRAAESTSTPDPLDAIKDPKIREALRKMHQLDRILAKKISKEKEVKHQRLQAHRELERQLLILKPEGREEQREVSDNTTRYLALVPPPSHTEGVSLDEDSSVDPVFQTQPREAEKPPTGGGKDGDKKPSNPNMQENNAARDNQTTSKGETKGKGHAGKYRSKGKGHVKNQQGGSDFIQRNIDLASDAVHVIAMTDDEKKRLEELLQDVEMLVDEEDQTTKTTNVLQVSAGTGYIPDASEQLALEDIDAKLKMLLPSEDYERISTTPSQTESIHYYQGIDLGEKVLRDAKHDRYQQERLRRIEDELDSLEDRVEREIYNSSRLSQENLSDLLEQCSELSSRAANETDSILHASPRSPAHSVPTEDEGGFHTQETTTPRLPDDVLHRLLAEARESLSRSESGLSSLTPVSSLDTQQLSSRSDISDPPAVVSYNTIQELLRNPRATSLAVSTTGLIMDVANRSQDMQDEELMERASLDWDASADSGTGTSQREILVNGGMCSRSLDSAGTDQVSSGENPETWQWSSPRASHQSPTPLNRENNKSSSTGKKHCSLSLRSFSNSTDLPSPFSSLKSPEPPPPRNAGPSAQEIRSPLRSTSPLPLLNARNSDLMDPSPPQSRRTTRTRKPKSRQDSRISTDDRTDSQASTNTLVTSSDFEYEEDEAIAEQLLTADLPGNPGRAPSDEGVTARCRITGSSKGQNVLTSIARFETKEDKQKRFSPPLV